MTKPCDGHDMWRRVDGCLDDPRTAGRLPQGDRACDMPAGVETSGYCDCKDGIPRYFKCGVVKKPCRAMCARPPPASTLSAAFAPAKGAATKGASAKGASTAPPWWRTHLVTVVGGALALVLFFVHLLTPHRATEARKLASLVQAQRRRVGTEIAFEREGLA